jgi:multicomponent Na+:H+ antiporter subunit G
MTEIVTGVMLLVGSSFMLVAGIGILRMPDLMIRMHASTKAGTLGCGLILVAAAVYFQDVAVASRAIAAILFLLITAPVAAHMIARAAYCSGIRLSPRTVLDEWASARAAEDGLQPRSSDPTGEPGVLPPPGTGEPPTPPERA